MISLVHLAQGIIFASKEADPGLQDMFGNFRALMLEHGDEAMSNTEYLPNTGEIPTYFPDRPPAEPLAEYTASWSLESHPRTFALIVEDMEKDYASYIDFVLPNAVSLLAAFRESGQPVVWTNWYRQEGDGAYGAIDRFYGPQGIYPPGGTAVFDGHAENPMWIDTRSDTEGTDTVDVLKPVTPEEQSLVIKSMHLSKFADKTAAGEDILYPMLKAWGVNTVVVIGAWTEDCIISTAVEASDRYGLDVVIVKDALATATPSHTKAIEVMASSCALAVTADEMISYLSSHADKIVAPKAPLSYPAVLGSTVLLAADTTATAAPVWPAVSLPLAIGMAVASSLLSVFLATRLSRRGRLHEPLLSPMV